jgi:putative FmdB family regulatory protein
MPIYAYRCSSCGHAKDVLQKLSDAPLTTCPACGAESFSKQVTAAGFQLKGSGWYATDFRGGSSAPAPATAGTDGSPAKTDTAAASPAAGGDSGGSTTAAAGGSCGGGCACH